MICDWGGKDFSALITNHKSVFPSLSSQVAVVQDLVFLQFRDQGATRDVQDLRAAALVPFDAAHRSVDDLSLNRLDDLFQIVGLMQQEIRLAPFRKRSRRKRCRS